MQNEITKRKDVVKVSDDHEKGELLNLSRAEEQVIETEDASLQDDSYSFDEENTGREEYHDASDIDGELESDHQPI